MPGLILFLRQPLETFLMPSVLDTTKVLYTSQGHQMGAGGMLGLGGMEGMHGHGMHGYGMHKFHNGGYNSQAPSQNSTSSSIPSSYE